MSKREICLDTETTGLKPQEGHRVIEIGAVELVNRLPTGRHFHVYIDPEREVPEAAVRVHGLTWDKLRGKPKFAEVAEEFLEFIADAPLVIHNADFDRGFLNWELSALNMPLIDQQRCIDTLQMARRRFPMANNTLDGLCKRFGIDNAHRTLHGALLDAEILAEVYLELTGGRQIGLTLLHETSPAGRAAANDTAAPSGQQRYGQREKPLPPLLSDEEREKHAAFVETLGEGALWKKYL